MLKTDTAEILNSADKSNMAAFVDHRYKEFLVAMYAKKYNIDSLFPDSVSKALFLENPFLAEFPSLKSYKYDPVFTVSNRRLQDCRYKGCFIKDVYDVFKTNRFIRPANLALGLRADSLFAPPNTCYILLSTNVTEADSWFAVYFKKGQTIRMVGGSAFLDGFPEPVQHRGRYARQSIAEIVATTRLIGKINTEPSQYDDVLSPGFFRESLDTIGSFINAFDFFVHTLATRLGQQTTNIGRVDRLVREFTLFYFAPKRFWQSINNPESKLVIVEFPVHREYTYWIPHLVESIPSIVLKESWEDINVFTIYFTRELNEQYKKPESGYRPGFYAYEVKQTFKNRPETPEDNFPHVRGMSKEEFEQMKSKPYLKDVCHEEKL